MNCADYLDYLNGQLDGAHPDVQSAEQHFGECSECRDLHRSGRSASREYSEYVLLVGGFKFILSAVGVRPTAGPALDPC